MPPFERVSVMPFEVKEVNVNDRTAWMVASTPAVDRAREVVSAEAMEGALERYMQNPVITWQHRADFPIGHAKEGKVTKKQTQLKVYFSAASQCSNEAFGLVSDGTLRAMSIGFNPYSRSFATKKDAPPDFEMIGETLTWKNIDWLETAVVTIPCNQEAIVGFAKGLGLTLDLPQDLTQDEAEEARFLDDLQRLTGGAESVRNYHRHLLKQGLVLTAAHRADLTQAQAVIAEVLEPYPAPDEEPAPQGALSLPTVSALALPTPQGLALPGG